MSVPGPLRSAGAAFLALAACISTARGAPPVPDAVRDAEVAMGFDPKGRCPDLQHADAGDRSAALVLFLAGPTGVPSRATVKASSGSASLDAAAVSCVLRLRFLPAVHAGDGNAIDSWQEIAWKWGRFHTETASAPAAVGTASTTLTMTSTASAATAAEARVCLDARGALSQDPVLTHASGDAGLDAAALRAARSAAPGVAGHAGCLRITLTAEDAAHDPAR